MEPLRLEFVCVLTVAHGKDDKDGNRVVANINKNAIISYTKTIRAKPFLCDWLCEGQGIFLRSKPFHFLNDPARNGFRKPRKIP